jgi:hypothetical protein
MIYGEWMHKGAKTLLGCVLMLGLLGGFPGPRPVFAGTGSGKRGSLEEYLGSYAYYPFSLDEQGGERFILFARINERKVVLLVDTGCPVTVLDTRKVPGLKTLGELNMKLADSQFGELADPSILLIDRLAVGGAQFSNQPARASKLEADHVRLNFEGMIGLDFLLRNFCIIDCGNEQIFFRGARPTPEQSAAMARTFRASGFTEIPIRCTRRLIMASMAGDRPFGWIVDTGATFTVIEDSYRVKLNLKPVEHVVAGSFIPSNVEGKGYGLNGHGLGTHKQQVVCLPELAVGPQTWHNLYVGVSDLNIADLARDDKSKADIHGLFGADLLMRHGAVIDFSSQTIWLRPDR